MAESNSPITQKLFSLSTFFRARLLPTLVFGILSATLLAVAIGAAGLGAEILALSAATSPGEVPEAGSTGLGTFLKRLETTPLSASALRVRAEFPWLLDGVRSFYLVTFILAICLPLRWLLSSGAMSFVQYHCATEVQKLRQAIHRKAIRLEPADLTGEHSRSTDRLFGETSTALEVCASDWGQRWISGLPDLMTCLILALIVDWRIGLQVIIPVILCWFVLGLEYRRTESSSRLLLEQVDRGLRRLAESLRKARIVCGFSMEQTEQHEFEKNLNQYQQRKRLLDRQTRSGWWARRFLLLFCVVVPGMLLARQILVPGRLSVAAAVIIGLCALFVYRSLTTLRSTGQSYVEAIEKVDEIGAYISRVPLVSQVAGARFLEPMTRSLQFDQVNLSMPQQPALLRNLDLRISAGERIALLSLNPMSAYALASMIPRFADPDSGQVLIDGQDIRQTTLESLRAEAIFVGGKDPVFNATVLENISCGQADITRQQVQDACKLVHADNFIRQLPKGYEAVVGEHGLPLDVGQTFRLSLARAAVRQPALLMIEEPDAVLDPETKAISDFARGEPLSFFRRVCQP